MILAEILWKFSIFDNLEQTVSQFFVNFFIRLEMIFKVSSIYPKNEFF